jgi:hypothetical protein
MSFIRDDPRDDSQILYPSRFGVVPPFHCSAVSGGPKMDAVLDKSRPGFPVDIPQKERPRQPGNPVARETLSRRVYLTSDY